MSRSKKQVRDISRVVGVTSAGLLGLIALGLLFPTVQSTSLATEASIKNNQLTPSLGLSLPQTHDWQVNPNQSQGVALITSQLTISSTGTAGYKIYLSASDNQAALVNLDASVPNQIKSIENASIPTNFPANTWGYNLERTAPTATTTFSQIPQNVGTVALEATTGGDTVDQYQLSFATKVDTSLPAGTYTGKVLVSVIATPFAVHSLSDITYMQEMTPYVCDYSTEDETKQLIDTRDGKSYWVAKLKDGNCWMVQNLALDLSTEVALTPEDSDVSSSWTPTSSTNGFILTEESISTSVVTQYSWNLGKLVLATPSAMVLCNNYGENDANSATTGENLSEVCQNSGIVDVSDSTWQDTFHAQPGSYNGRELELVSVNEGNRQYDAHYLIGNYYQYSAATAGDEQMKSSICAKGWKLPSADSKTTNGVFRPVAIEDSYYNLTLSYGYPQASEYEIDSIKNTYTKALQNAYAYPFYFIEGGYIGTHLGYVRYVGQLGALWSNKRFGSTSHAAASRIYRDEIPPSYSNGRFIGNNVRCLAR